MFSFLQNNYKICIQAKATFDSKAIYFWATKKNTHTQTIGYTQNHIHTYNEPTLEIHKHKHTRTLNTWALKTFAKSTIDPFDPYKTETRPIFLLFLNSIPNLFFPIFISIRFNSIPILLTLNHHSNRHIEINIQISLKQILRLCRVFVRVKHVFIERFWADDYHRLLQFSHIIGLSDHHILLSTEIKTYMIFAEIIFKQDWKGWLVLKIARISKIKKN